MYCAITLRPAAEEEQRDHVEQQVRPIGMDEAVRQQAVELLVLVDRRRPQDQPLRQLAAVRMPARTPAR